MKNTSLVSITDYSKADYMKIMEVAADFEKNSYQNLLNGKVIGTLFF
jgi:aspartate carbamoyltransferase catalytic subunit